MMHGMDLLSTPQTAVILGCSIRTVGRLVESGALPVAHQLPGPNGARLFAPADVERTAEMRRNAEVAS